MKEKLCSSRCYALKCICIDEKIIRNHEIYSLKTLNCGYEVFTYTKFLTHL